jgi:hypothetical protein
MILNLIKVYKQNVNVLQSSYFGINAQIFQQAIKLSRLMNCNKSHHYKIS